MEPTPTPGSDRGGEFTAGSHEPGSPPIHGSLIGAWLRRNQARINACGGALLLFLAVLIPVITPMEQRGEVLIMTILFGLTGALMLYSAATTASSATDSSQHTHSTLQPVRQAVARRQRIELVAARKALLAYQTRRNRGRALAGLIFGLLFTLAGVVAPFVLNEGNANPDARFLMMIGFSPVAISGGLMVLVFGRTLRALLPHPATSGDHMEQSAMTAVRSDSIASTLATVSVVSGLVLTGCAIVLPFLVSDATRANSATASIVMGGLGVGLSLIGGWVKRRQSASTANVPRTTVRRAPVPRVPGSILYRVVVPAAIVVTLLLIVAVILVVVAATVTPLVR